TVCVCVCVYSNKGPESVGPCHIHPPALSTHPGLSPLYYSLCTISRSRHQIIQECNREVGRMKQTEELIHIAKKIAFDKIKAVPIISQARFLEKQGELSEVQQKGSLFGIKPKLTPVYFFLFSDFLLITLRK
ncbi:hypothetical protein FKM82_029948, partial [Ascaphus truei]